MRSGGPVLSSDQIEELVRREVRRKYAFYKPSMIYVKANERTVSFSLGTKCRTWAYLIIDGRAHVNGPEQDDTQDEMKLYWAGPAD